MWPSVSRVTYTFDFYSAFYSCQKLTVSIAQVMSWSWPWFPIYLCWENHSSFGKIKTRRNGLLTNQIILKNIKVFCVLTAPIFFTHVICLFDQHKYVWCWEQNVLPICWKHDYVTKCQDSEGEIESAYQLLSEKLA